MSRKHVLYGFKIFDAVSLASTQTSVEVEVGQADYGSIFLEWTGTAPIGVVTVQAKNGDKGTYRDLDFSSSISVSGSSGSHDIILNDIPFTHLKLIYTRTSGTGSATASITTKSSGA